MQVAHKHMYVEKISNVYCDKIAMEELHNLDCDEIVMSILTNLAHKWCSLYMTNYFFDSVNNLKKQCNEPTCQNKGKTFFHPM